MKKRKLFCARSVSTISGSVSVLNINPENGDISVNLPIQFYFATEDMGTSVEYNNTVYTATYGGGIYLFDATTNNYLGSINSSMNLGSDNVYNLLLDGSTLYVATQNGLSILDLTQTDLTKIVTKTYTKADDNLATNYIYSLVKDGDNLFVGTTAGLSVLDISAGADKGTVSKTYTQAADNLGSDNIYSLVKDGNNLFVGTTSGLSVLDISAGADKGAVSRTYTQSTDNLGDNSIRSLLKNGDNLLVGTSAGGLSVLDISAGADKGTVTKTYTTEDGLAGLSLNPQPISIIKDKIYLPIYGGLSIAPINALL